MLCITNRPGHHSGRFGAVYVGKYVYGPGCFFLFSGGVGEHTISTNFLLQSKNTFWYWGGAFVPSTKNDLL